MDYKNREDIFINTEQEIKRNLSDRHLIDDIQSFSNCEQYLKLDQSIRLNSNIPRNLDIDISFMKDNAENRAYRVLHSNRPIIGKPIVFFKKVLRKFLKWYIDPICNQQTDFNKSSLSAIETLRFELGGVRDDSNKSIDICLSQISNINSSINILKNENESLNNKIDTLKNENENLNNKIDTLKNEQQKPKYSFGHIVSSSQSGEDTIIAYILDSLGIPFNECTYLDLGANHAKFMSNTYMMYCFGARGVLVEANPKLIAELKEERYGDLILNNCISNDKNINITFYIMSGDGLSTTDYNRVQEIIKINPNIYVEEKIEIESITIDEILKNYFSQVPMLVNIDVEGIELDILKNFDLKKRRPLIIIVETVPYDKHLKVPIKNKELIDFMKTMDYEEYAFTGINSIFIDAKRLYSYNIEDGRNK